MDPTGIAEIAMDKHSKIWKTWLLFNLLFPLQYMVRFMVGDGNTAAPFRFILLPNPGSYAQIKDVTDGGFL